MKSVESKIHSDLNKKKATLLEFGQFERYAKSRFSTSETELRLTADTSPSSTGRISRYGLAHIVPVREWQLLLNGRLRKRASMIDKLLEIRKRIKESGKPLLDWDEIEQEVQERRGLIDTQ